MKLLSFIAGLGLALSISTDTHAQASAAFFGFKDTTAVTTYNAPIDSLKDELGYYIERNLGIYRRLIKENIIQLEVQHGIIHINKPELIDHLRQYVLGVNDDGELADAYFAVIKPNGTKILLDKSELKNVHSNKQYPVFNYNWKNVEVGDQVEFVVGVYTANTPYRKSNLITYLPIVSSKFFILNPISHPIALDVSGLDDQIMYKQNEEEQMDMYYALFQGLPKVQDEQYSYPKTQIWTVGYGLAKKDGIQFMASNWDPFVNRIIENLNSFNKNTKAIPNLVAKIPITSDMDNHDKVALIETFVSEKIGVFDQNKFPQDKPLDEGLKKGKLGYMTQISFYTGVLEHFNIDYEIVLFSKRYNDPFNPYVPNLSNVDEVAIFIPSTGSFIFPNRYMIKSPYLPWEFEHTDRIHIKKTFTKSEGEYYAQLQFTESTPTDYSISDLNVAVDVTPEGWKSKLRLAKTGHNLWMYSFLYHPLSKIKNKSVLNLTPFGLNEYVDSIKVGTATHNFKQILEGKDTLVYENTAQSKFKFADQQTLEIPIGKLIGKQAYMESDSDRMFDINIDYRHRMTRKISINIPNGYKVKNLEEFNYQYINDENVLGFTSKATQNASVVTIDLDEYYGEIIYDKSIYTLFENVINAAEKFNKLNLILEKI